MRRAGTLLNAFGPRLLSSTHPALQAEVSVAVTGLWQSAHGTAAGYSAVANRAAGVVPPGHLSSDLSPTTCHIGLGRRRDLTLRQDLSLFADGQRKSLSEVLKGKRVIVVGFPGGPVCTGQHIPGYMHMAAMLHAKGVDSVVCITPDEPAAVAQLANQLQTHTTKVQLMADPGGAFIRLLGMEVGALAAQGPKCQRFAGIVDNGILLKVKVEASPADLKQTDVASMCALWDEVFVQ